MIPPIRLPSEKSPTVHDGFHDRIIARDTTEEIILSIRLPVGTKGGKCGRYAQSANKICCSIVTTH